jgi:DNA-binding LacI/PurR family transcriptional regulator
VTHVNGKDTPHATMREVARLAEVSLATVSYVANNGPKPVSHGLRDRVVAAMAELGYRRTRRGRTRQHPLTIGVLVPDMTNLFFSRVIGAIGSLLQAEGHMVMASSSNGDPDREAQLLAAFERLQVNGLLVTPVHGVPATLKRLATDGLPTVLMDWNGADSSLNRVVLDNYHSALQATRLLLDGGHRRIALVSGASTASSAQERLRGYRDALRMAGMPEAGLVRSGPFSHDHGRAAALDLLSLPEPPDAIFCGGVLLTLGVLQALRERRLRWPDDIAVVGYGDARWASVVVPALTVIEQPVEQLGEMSVKLLLSAVDRVATGQHVVLDSRLVVRESHWRLARVAG